MRLGIFGATGEVGKLLVRQALARGHSVQALARAESITPEMRAQKNLTFIEGSPLDSGAVQKGVLGSEAVLSCLGLKRKNPKNPWSALASPPDFASKSGQAIANAMQQEGINRLICVSAAGVGDARASLNWVMKFMLATSKVGAAYRDLAEMESLLSSSSLDWTACRPTTLTFGPETHRVKELADGAFPMTANISRADVAWWILELLEGKTRTTSRTPTITAE